jgi:ATP-dependent Clp protease ATP-binding subunit ClpC
VAIVVRPLVVVREHIGGFFSAAPAFAPSWVSLADEREDALDELRLFLGEHWAKLDGDQILERVIPEPAAVRELELVMPREDLRVGALRTPISLSVIELSAADDARWVIVPPLGHVVYVAKNQLDEFDERVQDEVRRVIAASDLDGADYLDLLPPLSLELERPLVEVVPERSSEAAQNRPEHVERQKKQAATKLLESVGRRLSASAVEVLHRDVARVRALLDASARASVVLVGPPGAGKSALVRAALRDCDRAVFATSGAELVAGQSFVGQLEKRIADLMRAAELLDAVLYFEDLDDLFAGRRGGYEDLAGPMQRWLEQQRVRLLGELSPEQYDRLQHRHVGFFSYVSRIAVEPLTGEQTADVLRARSRAARDAGAPALADAAAPLIVDLVERYDPYRSLPGKAIALLEELVAQRYAEPRADGSLEIDADDVFRGVSTKSGVPEFLLRDERSMLIDDVQRFFRQRLIGQHVAVRHVAETLCAVKAGLGSQTKPLATFLFIGPLQRTWPRRSQRSAPRSRAARGQLRRGAARGESVRASSACPRRARGATSPGGWRAAPPPLQRD